jgi:hypothetical protein
VFAEDPRQFFDTRDFGVAAVLKRQDGTTVRTAIVIVGTPTDEQTLLGEGRVTTATPRAAGATADLGDAQRNWTLTVGAAVYTVTAPPEDDGAGFTTLHLRKQ